MQGTQLAELVCSVPQKGGGGGGHGGGPGAQPQERGAGGF